MSTRYAYQLNTPKQNHKHEIMQGMSIGVEEEKNHRDSILANALLVFHVEGIVLSKVIWCDKNGTIMKINNRFIQLKI